MALIIAGDRSGVGKTTITLAMLTYLVRLGNKVQSFKVGPDYIDPMFHYAATGLTCRNLDPVLTSPDYVRDCFYDRAQKADWAIVEGVMGLFDGIKHLDRNNVLNDYGSTAHVARLLNLPVVLVLDCSRMSTSIAAIAYGYANLDPKVNIAGVILNQVASDRHLELLETALNSINMPVLGVLRRNAAVTIPDRHLGLVPEVELPGIDNVFSHLAHLAKTSFDWKQLFPLLKASPHPSIPLLSKCTSFRTPQLPISLSPVKIAVARDRAFNFYYQDNLDILTELGAELVFWSPIQDRSMPDNIQGLYFGGGFPEVFARDLAANQNVLQQLKQTIEAGIPTYAECGGLMYLCQKLIDFEDRAWSMVGVIPSNVTMQAKLTLGYRQAIALQNSPLVKTEQVIRGHEFHRSKLTTESTVALWQLQGFHSSNLQLKEGWKIYHLHASYLHVHWGETKFLAKRFIDSCRNYQI
jgi:cobyrinic acid a,c-diamide synthase